MATMTGWLPAGWQEGMGDDSNHSVPSGGLVPTEGRGEKEEQEAPVFPQLCSLTTITKGLLTHGATLLLRRPLLLPTL